MLQFLTKLKFASAFLANVTDVEMLNESRYTRNKVNLNNFKMFMLEFE